jgi:hypothetical protein
MDALAELALSALDTTVAGLLPAEAPGLNRQVRVLPLNIRPAGVGGYIGTHPDPRGNIFARRMQALVEVSISGGQDAAASAYLGEVARSLLAQDRAELRRKGIQRLRLKSEPLAPRSAQFELSYEYLHLPTSSEGVIDSLDLNLDLNLTPYRARHVWDLATRTLASAAQPLADFLIADDPEVNPSSPPSQWTYNAGPARIEQNAQTRGGGLTLAQPKKAGAQLLWRPGGKALEPARFIAATEFETTRQDGIGLVFARASENDYWYFLASQRHGYHVFGRKRGAGNYSFIGAPAGAGVPLNTRHTLTVIAFDRTLIAALDGSRTLEVGTDEPLTAGELGFLTHGNDGARFYRARLIELI